MRDHCHALGSRRIVQYGISEDGCTQADGDPLPSMPLLAARKSRADGKRQKKNHR
jgi:hypothetical protein